MIEPDGRNLVFLLGLPRSGTTLLSVILDRHPAVLCPPEPWLMLALESVGKVCARHPADSRLLGQAMSEFCDAESFAAAAAAFARTVCNRHLDAAGKRIFIDKTPRYFHILPFLHGTFPQARRLILLRNPLDVAASYRETWRIDLTAALNATSDYPVWSFDLILGPDRLLGETESSRPLVKIIRYEQLVSAPAEQTASVMRFLDLEPTADQCQFDLTNSSYAASFAGDRKILATRSPHTKSVGRWRSVLSRDEMQSVLDCIGADTFRRLGYGDSLKDLQELGVVDRGPERTAEIRSRVERVYAERIAEVNATARVGGDWWVGRLEAELAEKRAGMERLRTELAQSRSAELRSRIDAERLHLAAENAEGFGPGRRLERLDFENRLHERDREIAELRRATVGLEAACARLREDAPRLRRLRLDLSARIARAIVAFPHGIRRPTRPLPSITVVTPVLNGEAHIRETIESVLAQDYPRLQYIIVDGGSTDRTLLIVEEYRERIHRVISGPDRGMYDAIARGFDCATGEIFGWLNSDDLYEPGGLARVGEWFRDHPRDQVVYHEDTVLLDGWRFPNAAQPPGLDRIAILRGHILFQDGVFFRRSACQAVGGVDRRMRRAGDWDLWVRMSDRFRMRRGAAHQSCFRIRPGQISQDMAAYYAELEHVRSEWHRRIGPIRFALSQPGHLARRARNLLWRARSRRLFFPLTVSGCVGGAHPTPGDPPKADAALPQCPLTARRPDRLLFSSRDTRFGDPRIHCIYHRSDSDVAIVWPPMEPDELDALYERHYSDPEAKIVAAPVGSASPYAGYHGGGVLTRAIARIGVPAIFCRGVKWDDAAVRHILRGMRDLPRRGGEVRLLDVGCFEGALLDAISKETDWQVVGLESNANAVERARAAGHSVRLGRAEDAPFVLPPEMTFDVIHLGQTIEHFNEPLTVLRRLSQLLRPGGRVILTTPNLNSRQIDLFGPTWSHWHPPYHRFLFSPRSLRTLGRLSGLEVVRIRSHSHPYWTCMSVQLNRLGLGAAVPHTVHFPDQIVRQARSLVFWSKLLWDWRGRGDYLSAVFRKR